METEIEIEKKADELKEINCFWCNSEIKPPYILFTAEYRTILCKKCKKESFTDINKEEMTESQRKYLINNNNEKNWIGYLKKEHGTVATVENGHDFLNFIKVKVERQRVNVRDANNKLFL